MGCVKGGNEQRDEDLVEQHAGTESEASAGKPTAICHPERSNVILSAVMSS